MTKLEFIAIFFIYFLFAACANIKPISGGETDKKAPEIVSKLSTPNFQKNFQENKIILHFDEWVTLVNPNSNIIISPTTTYSPEIKLKGKKVLISFNKNEKLKENTTYSIQFGESIKDITENNVANNIKYVFSTGDLIDSLSISGNIYQSKDNKPFEKALICLYDNLDDTAFKKIKPAYITWSKKDGSYRFDNLKMGKYHIFGLLDKNQNYFFDQNTEAFAFLDFPIVVPDTNKIAPLFLSTEKIPLILKDKIINSGKGTLILNRPSKQKDLACQGLASFHKISDMDSIVFWYTAKDTCICNLNLENKSEEIKLAPYQINPEKNKFIRIKTLTNTLHPKENITFICPEPISNYNSSAFHLNNISNLSLSIDSLNPKLIHLNIPEELNGVYVLHVDSSAIQFITGNKNHRDSFLISYKTKNQYSRLEIELDSLTIGEQYLFQLYQLNKLIREDIIQSTTTKQSLFFPFLDPVNFEAKLIHDKNKNGEWDEGIYIDKTQPEKIWIWPIKELRADWDIKKILKL